MWAILGEREESIDFMVGKIAFKLLSEIPIQTKIIKNKNHNSKHKKYKILYFIWIWLFLLTNSYIEKNGSIWVT